MVWYTGVAVLIVKSGGLFLEASREGVNHLYLLMAVLCGIVIGMIKAKYLFYHIGKKNLERISLLTNPKLWQFYRKRFFVFLLLMIGSGEYLSGVAYGQNMALIALAVLELSIAVALFLSSYVFWQK